jgi:hypothetical protein
MKRITQEKEFCGSCNHMTKHEEWSHECNECGVELLRDDYRFELMYVGRYDGRKDNTTPESDPIFCSIACYTEWMKSEKPDEYDLENGFFSMYHHKKEVDQLRNYLK